MPHSPFQTAPAPATPLAAGGTPRSDTAHRAGVRPCWRIIRLGYRVPRAHFDGIVHAVFDRACYIECDATLLTLTAGTLPDGPTTLLLGREAAPDLRRALRRGEVIRCRDGRANARGVTLDLRDAHLWRVPQVRPALALRDSLARMDLARARLAQARRARSSVLDRDGAPAIARFETACHHLDTDQAIEASAHFVGWGEGLTPAGDDYLVGCLAALFALAKNDPRRMAFIDRLSESLAAQLARTTPIAAHCLRLARHGHFNAGILQAVDALRSEADVPTAQCALDALLAVGATSGADALTGIVTGFAAWSGAASPGSPQRVSMPTIASMERIA